MPDGRLSNQWLLLPAFLRHRQRNNSDVVCVVHQELCGLASLLRYHHFLPFSRYLNGTGISEQQEVGYLILSRDQIRITDIFFKRHRSF